MRPFPLNGRVPIGGRLHSIVHRERMRDHWCYTLAALNDAQVRVQLMHAEIIAHIAAHARYQVDQWVRVGRFRELPITERHWKFQLGITVYHIRMPSSTAHRRRFAENVLMELEQAAVR